MSLISNTVSDCPEYEYEPQDEFEAMQDMCNLRDEEVDDADDSLM